MCLPPLHQARWAAPRFPAEAPHLSEAVLALRPALHPQPACRRSPPQRRPPQAADRLQATPRPARIAHAGDRQRLGLAWQERGPERLAGHAPPAPLHGGRPAHQRLGRRAAVPAGRQGGGRTACPLCLAGTSSPRTHHDQAGVEPQARGQAPAPLLLQAGLEVPQRCTHPAPGPHRPRRLIGGRQGGATGDEPAGTARRSARPRQAGDHRGAGVVRGPHHLAPRCGGERAGEHGRVHQVTAPHRALAACRLRGAAWHRHGGVLVSLAG